MRTHNEIYTMLITGLHSYIKDDHIVLDTKNHMISEPKYIDNRLVGTEDKKIGTITISVNINDFINIYKDVLEDDTILAKDLLISMRSHEFYDTIFNEIDKGYIDYITNWIDEEIILTEV